MVKIKAIISGIYQLYHLNHQWMKKYNKILKTSPLKSFGSK